MNQQKLMQADIDQHLEQLKQLGTSYVAHRNGTLFKHLQGVWTLLEDWNNPAPVCLAGLYHSVYGTGGFEQQLIPLEMRHEIASMIGNEAEHLVYLFAACDRPLTHPRIGKQTPLQFHDRFDDQDYPLQESDWKALCEILLANELDLGRYDSAFYKKHLAHYEDLFARFEPWLSTSAIQARHDFEQLLSITKPENK